MRFIRLAFAAAAAVSLVALAGCAPAGTPEEQAIQEHRNFVADINAGEQVNLCKDAISDAGDLGKWEYTDDGEFSVDVADGILMVHAEMSHVERADDIREQSVYVKIPEGESPCVYAIYGFFK